MISLCGIVRVASGCEVIGIVVEGDTVELTSFGNTAIDKNS